MKPRVSIQLFTGSGLSKFNVQTEIGRLFCLASPFGLRALLWKRDLVGEIATMYAKVPNERGEIFKNTQLAVQNFLSNAPCTKSLKFDLVGTDFQKKVWAELRQIKKGETLSYRELAARIATPNHSRAVGNANNKNPISLFIPCHRVIATNGNLSGYAGGTHIKKILLDLEAVHTQTIKTV